MSPRYYSGSISSLAAAAAETEETTATITAIITISRPPANKRNIGNLLSELDVFIITVGNGEYKGKIFCC